MTKEYEEICFPNHLFINGIENYLFYLHALLETMNSKTYALSLNMKQKLYFKRSSNPMTLKFSFFLLLILVSNSTSFFVLEIIYHKLEMKLKSDFIDV